jgi:starch-binding outer membrane protein, SusD/RagB family
MRYAKLSRAAGILALVALGACKSLDVVNPNEPDAGRALTDPAALEALAGGTLRTWWNAWMGMESGGVMTTQAQSFSSSWNNYNMYFYSAIDGDGTRNSRSWQNDPAATGRTSVEWLWTNYYSTLSSANDVIKAIREGGVVIGSPADTKRAEAVALLMQGATLSGIAMNYDKGYIVDETTDVSTLAYSNRKEIRDAAVTKLLEAATLAKANVFATPAGWTNGRSYSNDQIARVAYTMAAMTLAYWPRNAAENTAVNWATVATYAAQGMSSGTRFDFLFVGDGCVSWCPQILTWFNDISSGRVHTRVANLLDPVTQKTPYPAGGNPQPNSPDRRLGDGSFGDEDLTSGFGTIPKTANGGTDFAWSADEVFRPDRGSYHQSNIGHMRYDLSGVQDPTGIWAGYGPAPSISAGMNDLIWAEALIRSGGSLGTAASLINNTRVTRGGLPPAAAGDGTAGLLAKLQYENEIELIGLGAVPFYNRRRIDGLITGTPREMPVPAKELGVLGEPLYTWGGATPSSPTPP